MCDADGMPSTERHSCFEDVLKYLTLSGIKMTPFFFFLANSIFSGNLPFFYFTLPYRYTLQNLHCFQVNPIRQK